MKQNEFILNIQELTEKDKDKYYYFELEGYSILITAWDLKGKFLIDNWITELYPQLQKIGIEEVDKSELYYKGPMGISELKEVLSSWGFIISGSIEHHKASAGLEVECKIKPKSEILKSHKTYKIEELEIDLEDAISNEDFESAVIIRDEIDKLKEELE
jgi:hypothetical protein